MGPTSHAFRKAIHDNDEKENRETRTSGAFKDRFAKANDPKMSERRQARKYRDARGKTYNTKP